MSKTKINKWDGLCVCAYAHTCAREGHKEKGEKGRKEERRKKERNEGVREGRRERGKNEGN